MNEKIWVVVGWIPSGMGHKVRSAVGAFRTKAEAEAAAESVDGWVKELTIGEVASRALTAEEAEARDPE